MTDADTLGRIEAHALNDETEQALTLARESLAETPDDPRLNAVAGALLAKQGQPHDAEAHFLKALEGTDSPDVHLNLAIVLRQTGRVGEAIGRLEALIARGESTDPVKLALANAYDDAGRLDDALSLTEDIATPDPTVHYNRGTMLLKARRFGDALAAFGACGRAKDFSLDYNRGLAEEELGSFEQAAASFDAAVENRPGEPNARWHLAQCLLRLGDYAGAWPHYAARYDATELKRHPGAHPSEGLDLTGKDVLVYAEQGAGDETLFSRFIPALQERAAKITWESDPRLVALLRASFPGVDFVPRGETGAAEGEAECRITAADIGLLTAFDPTATAPPHLTPDEAASDPSPHGGGGRRIGVSVFTAGTYAWKRTPPTAYWRELFARPDLDFVGLDIPSPAYSKWAEDLPLAPIDGLAADADFTNTARLLATLDGIVTIDNTLANLAGALGLKAVVVLSRSPDWRWGAAGDHTPWYPSLTLARQDADGSWDQAFETVARFLKVEHGAD